MPAPITYTENDLRQAIESSTSWKEVHIKLGYRSFSGRSYERLKLFASHYGVDCSHVVGDVGRSYSDEALSEAVRTSTGWKQVCLKLGLPTSGGSTISVRNRAKSIGLDVSHVTGKRGPKVNLSLEDILVDNSTYTNTSSLKEKLVRLGLLGDHCEICGLSEWLEKPLSLQLDHIDGRRRNNTLTNLRLLCPNCHSQTETWGGRNKRSRPD
jgi:hypothetical protein